MFVSRLLREIASKWLSIRKTTEESVQSARHTVFRIGVIAAIAIIVIWLSIFLYITFYYTYMPSMSHVRPVHLQFTTCEKQKGICSFPHAFVKLTHKQQILMVGQPYKVNLHLEMPESPRNKELGMFMVCAEMQSSNGNILEHACRSAMLHYRSTLLHTITTLIFSPMMIFGNVEEKQDIVLELFNNFEEDQNRPVTNMYIEIQSKHIELYSATLMINAHLSGLRYWMFNWPILTAGIGTSTILFFITFVCTMSYLHIGSEEEGVEDSFTYEKGDGEHEKILKIMDEEIPEEAPDTMRDYSEEKVSASEKRIKGEMGHIQEISTLVSTSSKLDEK